MNSKAISIALLVLALLPISTFSKEIYWSDVPFKKGQTIHETRSLLIRDGWKPIQEDHTPEWEPQKSFFKAGVIEVVSCAGTGAAPCIFFYKKGDACLTVFTSGEESPEDGYFAGVTGFNFECVKHYVPGKGPVSRIKAVVDSSGLHKYIKVKERSDGIQHVSIATLKNEPIKTLKVKFSSGTMIYNLSVINKNNDLRLVYFTAQDFEWRVAYYWEVESDTLYYKVKNLNTKKVTLSKNLRTSNYITEYIISDLKQRDL